MATDGKVDGIVMDQSQSILENDVDGSGPAFVRAETPKGALFSRRGVVALLVAAAFILLLLVGGWFLAQRIASAWCWACG